MKNKQTTLFDNFANLYDLYNNLISLGTHKFVKANAVSLLDIKDNQNILDLCTGTGDIANLIHKKTQKINIIGVDISDEMLKVAKKKSPHITFKKANVCELPFENNQFDVAVISFGLRNIPQRTEALKEIHRVLKNGGQFLHIDFSKKNTLFFDVFKLLAKINSFILNNEIPTKYFLKSIQEYPTPKELKEEVEQIGFAQIKTTEQMFNVISTQLFVKTN